MYVATGGSMIVAFHMELRLRAGFRLSGTYVKRTAVFLEAEYIEDICDRKNARKIQSGEEIYPGGKRRESPKPSRARRFLW